MEQPPSFISQGESGKMCRLNKPLYELKQSPRAWFGRFVSVVRAFGLSHSQKDHFILWRQHQ